ncbi:hypothetical protein DITRI_Ditri16bG0015000 [Diplodiscus trichospermus]
MEPELKQFIMNDLDSFVERKEYFENVGRAWKRGTNVSHDRAKVKAMHGVEEDNESNRSGFKSANGLSKDPGATLSGLLNFIDGLWSSCGDERIIIFTTNHKEKLDPALLRPGRMDVHVYMGYCTPAAFRKLLTTYLGIKDDKPFGCIDDLIKSVEVTPAEVAQQLMISDEPKTALKGLIEFLNMKKKQKEEGVDENEEKGIKEKEVEKKIIEIQNSNLADKTRCIYFT